MLKDIIKKITCSHEKMTFVGANGEGVKTTLTHKCMCCGYITTNPIKVKTK